LELAFCTEEIRDICTLDNRAIDYLGAKAAAALRNRLSDIRAADFIGDVLAGNLRQVLIHGVACCLIDLDAGCILTIACNQPSPKTDQNGEVDWSKVRRVKVTSLGCP